MHSTLARIQQELVSDGLVFRYEIGRANGNGLRGKEGTFSICTFCLADVLAKMGKLPESLLVFERSYG